MIRYPSSIQRSTVLGTRAGDLPYPRPPRRGRAADRRSDEPPFSAAVHVDGPVAEAAFRHISSALAPLVDGGRLVVITGANLAPDAPAWREGFIRAPGPRPNRVHGGDRRQRLCPSRHECGDPERIAPLAAASDINGARQNACFMFVENSTHRATSRVWCRPVRAGLTRGLAGRPRTG